MAIYHLHVKVNGRKSGSSAVPSAAYCSASLLRDERLERSHHLSAKRGVVHSEVLPFRLRPKGPPHWRLPPPGYYACPRPSMTLARALQSMIATAGAAPRGAAAPGLREPGNTLANDDSGCWENVSVAAALPVVGEEQVSSTDRRCRGIGGIVPVLPTIADVEVTGTEVFQARFVPPVRNR
jgi:hypothetical protein